jgi:hypothetical protein
MLRSCYVETNMLRIRFPSRRSLAALKKVSGAHVKVGLIIAAVFFAVACAVETRAILALESSPNPLEDPLITVRMCTNETGLFKSQQW